MSANHTEQNLRGLDSDHLMDRLGTLLGFSQPESAEERWNDEVLRRQILRRAIVRLNELRANQ